MLFDIPELEKINNSKLKVFIPKNLDEKIEEITSEEVEKLQYRLHEELSPETITLAVQKSKDLTDAHIKDIISTSNSIFDVPYINITNFNGDSNIISLKATLFKDVEFERKDAQDFFENLIFTTYRTSLLYSLLGYYQKNNI